MTDVIRGDGPAPSLVLSMVQRLPDDSLTVALAAGGRHLFGWTPERLVLSDIFDALNLNTKATGNWKSGPPDLPQAHRPTSLSGSADTDDKPRVSVAALYSRFAGGR